MGDAMKQDTDTPSSKAAKAERAHPINIQNAKLPPELARSRYGKWRALSLILVYVAMIVHITHWKVSGKTMAPLELSEIMKALELGVISPGVIFIGLMLIGSAIFGRFFCSWACHMLALQDLFHWILKKLRIRPRVVRSRVLLLVPFLTAGYMFFWPQVKRVFEGRALPEASARLTTTDFWRDLPGPLVIALTVLCCGFLVVYLFGGRGFCTYGCPYGVLFGIMDRFSPGKIRAVEGCEQCARCTAICTSNVRVHEEVKAYGMVVDPRCMKDLDCVSVCPNHALKYAFGRPTVGRSWSKPGYGFSVREELGLVALFAVSLFAFHHFLRELPVLVSLGLAAGTAYLGIVLVRSIRRSVATRPGRELPPATRYDFSLIEEIAMVVVFAVALFTWRGLYDRLPFLMSIALSAATAYVSITVARLFHRTHLDLNRYRLKHEGRLTRAGRAFAAASTVFLLFALHSCFVQYHRWQGDRYLGVAQSLSGHGVATQGRRRVAMEKSAEHFQVCDRFGLVSTTKLEFNLGTLMLGLDRKEEAELYLKRCVDRSPTFVDARVELAGALARRGKLREAVNHLTYALELYSPHEEYQAHYRRLYAIARARRGGLCVQQAMRQRDPASARVLLERAEADYRGAVELDANNVEAHIGLGFLAANAGPEGLEQAKTHYLDALRLDPHAAEAHSNLGDVYVAMGLSSQAIAAYREALQANPDLERVHFKLGVLSLGLSELSDALGHLAAAVEQAPEDGEARQYYGRALQQAGRHDEAREQFERVNALGGGR